MSMPVRGICPKIMFIGEWISIMRAIVRGPVPWSVMRLFSIQRKIVESFWKTISNRISCRCSFSSRIISTLSWHRLRRHPLQIWCQILEEFLVFFWIWLLSVLIRCWFIFTIWPFLGYYNWDMRYSYKSSVAMPKPRKINYTKMGFRLNFSLGIIFLTEFQITEWNGNQNPVY